MEKTNNYLYLPAWVKVLIEVGNDEGESIVNISRSLSSAYAHTLQVIKLLQEKGLVKLERVGRRRKIKLTGKGLAVYSSAMGLRRVIDDGAKEAN